MKTIINKMRKCTTEAKRRSCKAFQELSLWERLNNALKRRWSRRGSVPMAAGRGASSYNPFLSYGPSFYSDLLWICASRLTLRSTQTLVAK